MIWKRKSAVSAPPAETAVEEFLTPGAEKIYIFFAGGLTHPARKKAAAGNAPRYEFFKAAEILDASKLFVRDPAQVWYQSGLPGIGDSAYAVGDYLEKKIEESGASQVRFVGNCMGGYAALLFAAMLRRDSAIAFVPTVFLGENLRREHDDRRWPAMVRDLYQLAPDAETYDLRTFIASRYPELDADVYISRQQPLDVIHAGKLEGFENIRIHDYPDAAPHAVALWLRDQGKLADILGR